MVGTVRKKGHSLIKGRPRKQHNAATSHDEQVVAEPQPALDAINRRMDAMEEHMHVIQLDVRALHDYYEQRFAQLSTMINHVMEQLDKYSPDSDLNEVEEGQEELRSANNTDVNSSSLRPSRKSKRVSKALGRNGKRAKASNV